jgi:orotidine-5'-phosphate decarboxylase
MRVTTQWGSDVEAKDRLIIALDVPDIKQAIELISATRDSCSTYKVGLELFVRFGLSGVERIQAQGVDVFLDLKLHDIPNTVYSALLQVLPLHPKFITVHASGGTEMLMAAKKALGQSKTKLLAVSVLTHLSQGALRQLGVPGTPAEIAANWLKPLRGDESFGAVCSPQELSYLRQKCGAGLTLVCPGVRPKQSETNDQTRIATPREALHNGADYLVIGRPITRASNPNLAARSIIHEMASQESF